MGDAKKGPASAAAGPTGPPYRRPRRGRRGLVPRSPDAGWAWAWAWAWAPGVAPPMGTGVRAGGLAAGRSDGLISRLSKYSPVYKTVAIHHFHLNQRRPHSQFPISFRSASGENEAQLSPAIDPSSRAPYWISSVVALPSNR